MHVMTTNAIKILPKQKIMIMIKSDSERVWDCNNYFKK
jgi:sugar lactone lactonase YvrE